MKKAELSMNVIVMAVIALLVLAVLSFIFIRGANIGGDGLLSCQSKEGVCQSASSGCGDGKLTTSWSCPKSTEDQVCCIDKEKTFGLTSS